MKRNLIITVFSIFAGTAAVRADVLTSGSATINFHQSAWNSLASGLASEYDLGQPVLTLSAFFNQGEANAFNYNQVLTNTQASPAYTNQIYAMNGPTVTNLAGRTTQATTFAFISGQLTNHTGSIGLGGIAQFNTLLGPVLYGDYTLQYDSSRIALGGSGWYLKDNIPPAAPAFDLVNVTTLETNHTLTISGNLGVTPEVAYLLYDTPGDAGAIVGDFSFTAQTAPPPLIMTVVGGSATINFDETAWNALASGYGTPPVLTLSAFFNQSQANGLTQDELLNDVQGSYSYTNEIYAVNGAVVTNLPTRYTQPTTFTYQRGDLTNSTGSIGLGGVARFAVFGGLYGNLLYGDYTLQYDTARIGSPYNGSGWYLKGNIPPAAPAFDLQNVNIVETNNSFSMSADLGVTYEVADLLYGTPSDQGAVVGTFNLTADTRAIAGITQLAITGGNLFLQGTNGDVGTSYNVLSTTNLTQPLSRWTTNATGIFDGNGISSNTIPINTAEPARFYRLQQP